MTKTPSPAARCHFQLPGRPTAQENLIHKQETLMTKTPSPAARCHFQLPVRAIIFVWFWCLTIVSATSKQCGNNGAIFSNQVVVSKSANSAWSVAAGDLNNDGWMDIASASEGDNKIAWYSNTKGKSWSGERIVSTNAISANKDVVADFNNDVA